MTADRPGRWEAVIRLALLDQKIIDMQARLAVMEEDRNAWEMAADGYRAMFDEATARADAAERYSGDPGGGL